MGWTIGREVMCSQVGGLSPLENDFLFRLADGESKKQIAAGLHLNTDEIGYIERDIRKKMGCASTAHVISRAWRKGLIRSVCLLLVVISIHHVDDSRRTRSSRTARVQPAQVRAKSGASGRGVTV